MHDARHGGHEEADREKRLVAASSVGAAVFLTGMKIVVGAATGSLGIVAEAAHSALDLAAAAVTYFAVRISGKPADPEHTYGHGKIENLSALFETGLLLMTCAWIVLEAGERLLFHPVKVEPSLWAFLVMGISIVVDVSRSRALARTAKKYDSQALEADALHFASDVWSSAVVIGGLLLVLVADRFGAPWLAKADAVAAVVVAGIVVYMSVQLGRKSVDDLLDAVPPGLRERLAAAARVPGVLDVTRLRVRRAGPASFVDVTLTVARHEGLERAHALAHAAEDAVRAVLPGADVTAHVEPVEGGNEGVVTTIRLLAARDSLGAHSIQLLPRADGRLDADLHLEVEESLSLAQAHDVATAFEGRMREAVPALDRIVTHIDPLGDSTAVRGSSPADDGDVRAALEDVARARGGRLRADQLEVRRVGGLLSVTFRVLLDPKLSIAEAHGESDRVERDLRLRLAGLGRVVIHAEPWDEGAAPTAG